jgi:hypothetical protein
MEVERAEQSARNNRTATREYNKNDQRLFSILSTSAFRRCVPRPSRQNSKRQTRGDCCSPTVLPAVLWLECSTVQCRLHCSLFHFYEVRILAPKDVTSETHIGAILAGRMPHRQAESPSRFRALVWGF